MSYEKWKQMWRNGHGADRLGQAFRNNFIDSGWEQLYYEEGYEQADSMITDWLIKTQHYPNVPTPLGLKE